MVQLAHVQSWGQGNAAFSCAIKTTAACFVVWCAVPCGCGMAGVHVLLLLAWLVWQLAETA